VIGVGSSVSSGNVDQLVELIGPVGNGAVRAVVLTGAPGAGKTTTLDALGRALLDQGVDTRRVVADDLGRSRPFGVVADLLGLDRVYPPRPDTLDHVLAALESLCTGGPVALCVDDAHRADPDSLEVLGRLSDLARDLPVVAAFTRRTLPERAALSALARRPDVLAVEVTGLGPAATVQLVRSRYGAPPDQRLRTLLDGTDGNPFRIRELLDELDRRGALSVEGGEVGIVDGDVAVSPSVEAGVRAHLGLLDRRARELLQVVAVWSGEMALAAVAEIMGSTPAAWVEPAQLAVEAGVLRWADDDRLTFVHDLYRDVVLGDLDPPVRRTLHAACATSLRRHGAGATLIARHAADAGGPEAVAALRAAAADLEHAPLQAAELLAVAAARVTDDSADADGIAIQRAGALAISGNVEAAERIARDRLARSTDPVARADLRSLLLFSLISAAQVDAALDEIETSIARTLVPEARDALADTRRWVTLLAGRQTLHGPPTEVARSPSGLVTDAIELFLGGRPDEGYERARIALQRRTQNPPRPWMGSPAAPVWPAYLALHVFGPRRARELSIDARREAQKSGRLWLTPYHQSVSAGINFQAGAWDDALAELEAAAEAAIATGTAWMSMATAAQLQILVRRGELDTAATTLHRWRARALPEQFGLPHVAQAEVLLLEARDQTQEAAVLARRTWHRALDRGRRIWPLLAGPDTLRVARAANDADLAARVAHDTAAVPVEHARALAPAARLVAAITTGNPAEATAAALDYRAIGNLPGEIAAWEEAACLSAARGAPEESRTAAARATALAAALGAVTVERRVPARLRRLDVRLGSRTGRRRPSTGWASLTPTELQVADLVGQGLTSPQVAARLYISPRTVQTHITHILRKLDLRSRVQLAAAISRRSPGQ